MENKNLTAVEWLLDRIEDVDNTPEIWEQIKIQANKMFEQQKIEFAKLHVQRALKTADEKATVTPIDYEEISKGSFQTIWGVDSESILTAYPLENIK